jgi:desulfoferrodoxin (superoxide reductase-like protein)
MKKKLKLLPLIALAYFALTISLFADKTAVKIIAPKEVKKGTEITITLNVSHNGNNIMHYTEWVYVKVNGKEYKRWKFSAFNRPEDEKFSLTFKIIVEEPLKIEARGSCNVHGSQGKATATISIK